MRRSRLRPPGRGLYGVRVGFSGLSTLGARALRALSLEGTLFAGVAVLSVLNCAGGLWAAWQLVTQAPAADG